MGNYNDANSSLMKISNSKNLLKTMSTAFRSNISELEYTLNINLCLPSKWLLVDHILLYNRLASKVEGLGLGKGAYQEYERQR